MRCVDAAALALMLLTLSLSSTENGGAATSAVVPPSALRGCPLTKPTLAAHAIRPRSHVLQAVLRSAHPMPRRFHSTHLTEPVLEPPAPRNGDREP